MPVCEQAFMRFLSKKLDIEENNRLKTEEQSA